MVDNLPLVSSVVVKEAFCQIAFRYHIVIQRFVNFLVHFVVPMDCYVQLKILSFTFRHRGRSVLRAGRCDQWLRHELRRADEARHRLFTLFLAKPYNLPGKYWIARKQLKSVCKQWRKREFFSFREKTKPLSNGTAQHTKQSTQSCATSFSTHTHIIILAGNYTVRGWNFVK